MRRFILRFSIFLLFLFIGAILLSHMIDMGLRKTRYSYYAQWNDLFDSKINADLLVLGSSRARQHFATQILDSALNLNSYVIGLEAYRFRMYYDVFNLYLRHNKQPKYLIISLDIYTLDEDSNSYYYQQFLPYLDEPGILEAYSSYKHRFTIADQYIPLHKYLGERTQIIVGLVEATGIKRYPETTTKGFNSLNKKWDDTFSKFQRDSGPVIIQQTNSSDIELLKRLLKFCNSNKIKVFLVFSPEYKGSQKIVINRDTIIQIYQSIASDHNCIFLDYSGNKMCEDISYFYNSQHMNVLGSISFTRELSIILKSSIIPETAPLSARIIE